MVDAEVAVLAADHAGCNANVFFGNAIYAALPLLPNEVWVGLAPILLVDAVSGLLSLVVPRFVSARFAHFSWIGPVLLVFKSRCVFIDTT